MQTENGIIGITWKGRHGTSSACLGQRDKKSANLLWYYDDQGEVRITLSDSGYTRKQADSEEVVNNIWSFETNLLLLPILVWTLTGWVFTETSVYMTKRNTDGATPHNYGLCKVKRRIFTVKTIYTSGGPMVLNSRLQLHRGWLWRHPVSLGLSLS